jgi:hypothetical protein
MFDAAAGSHLARPYWLAVLVAQAILPDFHVCAQGDSVAKLPLRRRRTKIPLVGEASAGAAHLNFSRKIRRHIGRPMFVRPPRLLNQQPGSRRQQRWMFVAILPAIHKGQKERADLPHHITRQ